MLEADGAAVALGEASAVESGAVAEVVERPAWAKVEVVTADEREQGAAGGRITLNLGHTVAHALEAVDGYATLLHGEAVAYGLRAATQGRASRSTSRRPTGRHGSRRSWTACGLASDPLPYATSAVLAATGRTRSTRRAVCAGCCRPPTASSCATTCRTSVVATAVASILAGRSAAAAGAGAEAGA